MKSLLLFVVMLLMLIPTAQAATCPAGFGSSVTYEVTFAAGNEKDFIVMFNESHRSGMQAEFGDVNFYQDVGGNQKQLYYWVQYNVSSVYADIWVNVTEVNQTSDHTSVLMCYDNAGATTNSSALKTLSYDATLATTDGWVTTAATEFAIDTANKQITFTQLNGNNDDYIYFPVSGTMAENYSASFRLNITTVAADGTYLGGGMATTIDDMYGGSGSSGCLHVPVTPSTYYTGLYHDDPWTQQNSDFKVDASNWPTDNTVHKIGDNITSYIYSINGSMLGDGTPKTDTKSENSYIIFQFSNLANGDPAGRYITGHIYDPIVIPLHASMPVITESVPYITLDSPLNQTYNDTTTVNLNWTNVSFQPDSVWYSLDYGTNTTIGDSLILTDLNSTTYYIELYANDTVGTLYSDTVTFTVLHKAYITVTSPANNSIQTPPYVEFNVSYTSVTGCNQSYISIDDGANITLACLNYTIPTSNLSSGNHNISFFVTNAVGGKNSTFVNFTILEPLVNCTGPGAFLALNFSFYDEENPQTPLFGEAEYAITVYTGSYNFTYNTSVPNTTSFEVCTSSGNWTTDAIIKYSGINLDTTYSTRFYFLSRATIGGNTNNISLYLLNDSIDSTISVTVQNSYGFPVEGIYINFQRYYITENAYRTVAMARTDNEGKSTVSLYPTNTWYKYVLVDDGDVENVIGPSEITTSELLLSLSPYNILTWGDYSEDITRSCSYSEATEFLVCTFTDTSGLFTEICLDVDTVGVLNNTDFAYTCLSTSSGTLMVNLSNATSINSSVAYYLIGIGSVVPLEQGTVSMGRGIFYGSLGIFITVIILCVCTGLGYYNPAVSMILGFMGVASAAIIGFVDIPTMAMGSLLVTVIGVIYLVKT